MYTLEEQKQISDILLKEKPHLINMRNFGIIAHVDAGKTTTSEQILVSTGLKQQAGHVHEGAATTDSREDEKRRGITIQSSSISTTWECENVKYEFNIIDTPGHIDFNIEVEKSLTVLDGAVLVIDGKEGVQTQTRTVVKQTTKHNVPLLCFINKLDGIGADFDKSFATLEKKIGDIRSIAIQTPVGIESNFRGVLDLVDGKYYYWVKSESKTYARPQILEIPTELQEEYQARRHKMLEVLADVDDDIASKVIEGIEITSQDIKIALRKAVTSRKLMAVLAGAAYKSIGIEPLLNAISLYLPDPVTSCKLFQKSEHIKISHHSNDFVGFVFNTMHDKFSGTLYFIRVYSGSLESGQKIVNTTTGKSMTVRRFARMFVDKKHDVDVVNMGDIVVISGVDELVIGDTLVGMNNAKDKFKMLHIAVPTPVIGQVITPATKDDANKLSAALKQIRDRDISVQVSVDPDTQEIELKGMGALQLDVIVDQLRNEFKIKLVVSPISVKYVETISVETAEYTYEHKKQTGGSGQYAFIKFALTPLPRGEGLKFEDKVVGGEITASFIKGIESAFFEFCKKSATLKKDAPLVDMKMTILGGKMHSVDSDELSFKLATRYGLNECIKLCSPILLEPIMLGCVEVNSEDMIGVVNGLIGRLEGEVVSQTKSLSGSVTIINAEIPSRTSGDIISELRNLTSGNASYSSEFAKFKEVSKETLGKINSDLASTLSKR